MNELELLYQALHSPLGISVRVSDYNRALSHLYKARSDSGDVALEDLKLFRSPFEPENELWIVKSEKPKLEGLK